MDKPIVIYDEARGKILAKYVENFGKFCEVDVTDQALQAVFRYPMAYGLSLAEHCEYEVDGNKFSTSLVKQEAPTIDLVQHGHWIYHENEVINAKCSVCNRYADRYVTPEYSFCPHCGARMDGDKE